jgi:hypothetical protein
MQFEEPYQLPPEFRRQPLTARLLEDYAVCARKFLLSFFVSREEEHRFRGGPAALHQAVRQALLDCYNQGGPAACEPQTLLDGFEAHWQGELCADTLEEEQLHEQGRRMLADYHADHCADEIEVLATDQRLEATLGDQAFVAVADVVLQPRGAGVPSATLSAVEGPALQVIRFITSRRPASEDELAEDLSAQLLWLLAREHYDDPHILYYALRQRRAREVVLDPDRAAYLRRDLASRAARLYREREFTPVKGPYCRWCRVRNRCPLWQR